VEHGRQAAQASSFSGGVAGSRPGLAYVPNPGNPAKGKLYAICPRAMDQRPFEERAWLG
jgi:hypothetical protein